MKSTDSDSGEDNMDIEEINNSNTANGNPWVNGIKPEKEMNDFISGFRKYWQDKNENIAKSDDISCDANALDQRKLRKNAAKKDKISKNSVKNKSKLKTDTTKGESISTTFNSSTSTSDWEVSVLNDSEGKIHEDVEQMFDSLQNKVNKKIKNKYDQVQKLIKTKQGKKTLKTKTKKPKKNDLTMKPSSQKQIIDEELLETTAGITSADNENSTGNFKNIMNSLNVQDMQTPVDINPEKFIEAKSTKLYTAIPDLTVMDENEEENEKQKGLILEAFEDDDIAEDFQKDKAKTIDEDTPKDIDLTLPGWGSWAGSGIKPSKNKTKRLILKMPPAPPRKDHNKGSLIINEKAESKMKPMLVSEIPFPFKTVKDYEAAIRAPIGNTFVPQRAFKKLIEPNVTTKMGAIIEPIRKSMLMGKKSA